MNTNQDSEGGVSSAQLTEFECPSCEEVVEARYQGTAEADEHSGHVVGWVCTECDAKLEEHVDHYGGSFDLRVVEEGDADD